MADRFNPDAKPLWWWSRGYATREPRGWDARVTDEVVAWMPMPDPPKVGMSGTKTSLPGLLPDERSQT